MTPTMYTKEQLAIQFADAFKAYQNADIEYRKASRLLDSDEDNHAYEMLWNVALDKVSECQVECIELLYLICFDAIPGFTRKDANTLMIKKGDDILSLVSMLAR